MKRTKGGHICGGRGERRNLVLDELSQKRYVNLQLRGVVQSGDKPFVIVRTLMVFKDR